MGPTDPETWASKNGYTIGVDGNSTTFGETNPTVIHQETNISDITVDVMADDVNEMKLTKKEKQKLQEPFYRQLYKKKGLK